MMSSLKFKIFIKKQWFEYIFRHFGKNRAYLIRSDVSYFGIFFSIFISRLTLVVFCRHRYTFFVHFCTWYIQTVHVTKQCSKDSTYFPGSGPTMTNLNMKNQNPTETIKNKMVAGVATTKWPCQIIPNPPDQIASAPAENPSDS